MSISLFDLTSAAVTIGMELLNCCQLFPGDGCVPLTPELWGMFITSILGVLSTLELAHVLLQLFHWWTQEDTTNRKRFWGWFTVASFMALYIIPISMSTHKLLVFLVRRINSSLVYMYIGAHYPKLSQFMFALSVLSFLLFWYDA